MLVALALGVAFGGPARTGQALAPKARAGLALAEGLAEGVVVLVAP